MIIYRLFSLVAITNKKQKWKGNARRETDDIKHLRILEKKKKPEPKWKRLRHKIRSEQVESHAMLL